MKQFIFSLTGVAAAACLFTSCESKTPGNAAADSAAVKQANNVKAALASENALIKKDVEGVYKYCAKDFVDYGNGEMKPEKNIDSLKAGMKQFMDAFPDMKVDDLKAVAQGDTVIVLGIWSGTFKKDFMGMKATNKSFKTPDADIFVFNKNGQMISRNSIQSEATYFKQLGITMPDQKK